jgi:FtsZ-binding cell division protein ZapB
LTEIHLHHYSGGMISEFHLLSEKINQLAELTRSLRRENADLRLNTAALAIENAELSRRMQQAHQRVSALLKKIPLSEEDEEAA